MNSIPSMNAATTPNTSFKGNISRTVKSAKQFYHESNVENLSFLDKIKRFAHLMKMSKPFVTSKRSKPTLLKTIRFSNKDTIQLKKWEEPLPGVTDIAVCRRDKQSHKNVSKIFAPNGKYIRTVHTYDNGTQVITDGKGFWAIGNENGGGHIVRFFNINQIRKFVRENWNNKLNMMELKPEFTNTAKKAAE